MFKRIVGVFCIAAIVSIIATGCTGSPSQQLASANVVEALSGAVDAGFARAYAPMEFQFPADHGAHPDYRTEWWYYTGNLADATGSEYGFQLTFFRNSIAPTAPERASDFATNQIYMAHFALTDVAANQHESFELYSRGGGGLAGATQAAPIQVWLEDWSMTLDADGAQHLVAHAAHDGGAFAIDLTLRPTRPPIFHGDRGLSQKGPEPGNASYYYSLTGMETTGTITSRGRARDVTGVSWMDHEFGTSALSAGALGWDWFSVQLDNGAVLMLAQIRTEEGDGVNEFEGTLVTADGVQTTISADEFTLSVREEWTSPSTGITYPSGWDVNVPGQDLALIVTPVVADQEMLVSFIYWEGAVHAEGTMAGTQVTGRGYVELTGYGGSGGYQR